MISQKRHLCPNRVSNNNKPTTTNTAATTIAKPNYYSKKHEFQSPKCPIPSSCYWSN